jgi:hypothetical protein
MVANAVDSELKTTNCKVMEAEKLLYLFIGSGEVDDPLTLITDRMMVGVRLVLVKGFATKGDFFDVTIKHKLIKISIHRREVNLGQGGMNSGGRQCFTLLREKLPDSFSLMTKSLLHTQSITY